MGGRGGSYPLPVPTAPTDPTAAAAAARLERLRGYRNRSLPDLSLSFLEPQFQREVARPFKQLEGLAELWPTLVPPDLLDHTRLESLSRGVLRVIVSDAARMYQLDRLLREGLTRQLTVQYHARGGKPLRRVKLSIGRVGGGEDEAEA